MTTEIASLVDTAIEQHIGDVRTDALDLSFGEIINLFESKELIIAPDYQRLFRWSFAQRSRLVESILLELPIPPFFVVENQDGVFELVDGLQRISSIIHFMNASLLDLEPLVLEGCELVTELIGLRFDDLPLGLRLRVKRYPIRTVVIKKQSLPVLRYEMFKRLNTGGELLSQQEIRNCSARMVGDSGIRFYEFLKECAAMAAFVGCIETISASDKEKKMDEELVLRFLALKNAENDFKGSVREWLTSYMDQVILEKVVFDYGNERRAFQRVFEYLSRCIGAGAFVRYRDGKPLGGLAPAYFEAVTMGAYHTIDHIEAVDEEKVRQCIIETVMSEQFLTSVGPAANTRAKLRTRIETVEKALRKL